MAQKLKPNTKIPTIAKQTSISSLNVASTNGNSKFKIPRVANLRRSKSVQDFRSLITQENMLSMTKQSSVANSVKRPVKRTVLTTAAVPNKIKKLEEKPKPIKNVPKIPPYDYKARFNHLKEIHDKLKIQFRELKESNETTADQNEELISTNNQLQTNLDIKTQKCDKLEAENKILKYEHSSAKEIITNLESKLDENLKLNTIMKEELRILQEEKRKMHNQIQELKGNIRVFCRLRPLIEIEEDKLQYEFNVDDTTIEIFKTNDKKFEFTFDKVFGPKSTQANIFEELSQLVQSALDGYNVCIFAYGQTGSGKTYTMEGENSSVNRGMVPRSIDAIFSTVENMKRFGWSYIIKASFLEIYNETIVDLLDTKKNNLEIKMCDAKGSDVYVPNLTTEEIYSAEKLKSLMKIAQKNRAVAATENNERSSRSHSVTKIILEGFNKDHGEKCYGNLNLIDLAGSEKFHTNETTRLRETTNINKSLSNLSNVILCLVKKSSHIPYRNSKLTHLLMPSLGGNSKTLMIVNISPLNDCYHESVNSLRFASSVNQCKTGTIKRMKYQS